LIRPLVPEEAADLAELLEANRAFLEPYEPEHAEDFFTAAAQRSRIETAEYLYGILDGDAIAGTISLSNVARGPFQSAHVGYWVDGTRNGRGLATRALAELVDLAFTDVGLHRLEAATLLENVASRRVLEKNGFIRIGVAPHYLQVAGAWRDHLLFQRTVED
jgi:ribosomal-protein-alanine N-acetyltransferase